MVNTTIIEVLAGFNKEAVHNVLEGRLIFKEDLKNFIVDLLRECEDDEVDYILERLTEEY